MRGRHNAVNFLRLREYKEIETMVEELSAVLIKKSSVADTKNLSETRKLMFEVYNLTTEEPYSFFFINLRKGDVNNMFL